MSSKTSQDAQTGSASSKVVTSDKKPPPESQEGVWTRRYIIIALWAVVLLVGLPIWWQTTTVYRAALPLSDMAAWADGKKCTPAIPILVDVDVHDVQKPSEEALIQHLSVQLNSLRDNTPSLYSFTFRSKPQQPDVQPALTVSLIPSAQSTNPTASFSSHSAHPILEIEYTEGKYNDQQASIETLITEHTRNIFSAEEAMVAHLLPSLPSFVAHTGSSGTLNATLIEQLEKRKTRSMRYASTYHLTFSLLTPEAQPSDWEIKKALAENISPLLGALSSITNFTVDTQVQPYAMFSQSIQPQYREDRSSWQLRSSDLGGFINAAEWPLSPSIGAGPTINFILYVPAESQSPLFIEDHESTSWLIRQWGGISIYNPVSWQQLRKSGSVSAQELRQPLATFSQHLLDLLGLPSSEWPFPLRIATQTRLLTLRLMASASGTLGSLARLTEELPSISIPVSVADAVGATTGHLEASCKAMHSGRFQQALEHARAADEEVERAFFHKSMVGQVYFPDEHKVAVYLPMLGPMAVPLIMTAMRELKMLRAR